MINTIKDKCFDIKYWLQRKFRGYADIDVWNLNDYIIRTLKEPIKKFVKEKRLIMVTGLTDKQWDKVLEDILWSFENYDKDSPMDKHFMENKNEELLIFCKDNTKSLNIVMKKEIRYHKRMKRGFALFGKYLKNLCN